MLLVLLPADAEALYEASCFPPDNNALEVRSLLRSGPTKIPQIQAAVLVPALPGCISEGDPEEKKICEAIELYHESVEDDMSFSPDAEEFEIAI